MIKNTFQDSEKTISISSPHPVKHPVKFEKHSPKTFRRTSADTMNGGGR